MGKYLVILAVLSILAVIPSCKKKRSQSYAASNQNSMFERLRSNSQKFTVTAGDYTTIVGESGTVINFYPFSFKDENGMNINSGVVNIELVEMYTPGEMIQNRTATMSGGRLLQSGGQIYIYVSKDNKEVFANKYGIGFRTNSGVATMQPFYPGPGNSDSIVTWSAPPSPAAPGTTANGATRDSTHNYPVNLENEFYYQFDSCTNFHFLNCDAFWDSPFPTTDLNIILPDGRFSPSNTEVFMVLPDLNATIGGINVFRWYDPATNSISTAATFPIGMNYKLVVIAWIDGKYFYYQTSGVITSSLSINATLSLETGGDIIARLKGL